jgi:hypothetical protein
MSHMSHLTKQTIMIVLCCNIMANAFSQTTIKLPVVNTTQTKVSTEAVTEKKFSLSTSVEYSQKVEVEANTERESGTDLSFLANYKINELYNINAKAALTQELSGPKNSSVSDTTVGFGIKGLQINNQLITTHSLSAVIPTSQTTRTKDRLRTAVGISNGIAFTSDNLTAKYKLSLSKNFHEFSQNAEGIFLNEYRISNAIDVIVPITEKFSVSATGYYRISFTYEKDQKYGFGFDGDLNYDFTKKLSANLGISNEGSALKANGTDSNINVYDEATSVTRAGLTYVY